MSSENEKAVSTDLMRDSGFDDSSLYDDEVKEIGNVVGQLVRRWSHKPNTESNLFEMEKEAVHKLFELGFVAHVDLFDAWVGGKPIIEIVGRVRGSQEYNYGFDHEKKGFQVVKSKERGEDYLGQKERS